MKKSTDIRVIKTQKALLEALEELLKNKKLSCITITELCTKAGINRNTFYYHYNNIYELLEEYKRLMINEINDNVDVNKVNNKESLIDLCKCIRRYPKFLNILTSSNCDMDYFNDIFAAATEKTTVLIKRSKEITSVKDYLTCQFCNAGTNAVICEWIRNGLKESPEDIADIISDAAIKGPISVLYPDYNN